MVFGELKGLNRDDSERLIDLLFYYAVSCCSAGAKQTTRLGGLMEPITMWTANHFLSLARERIEDTICWCSFGVVTLFSFAQLAKHFRRLSKRCR
jgi:hypothetical protein